MRAAVEQVEAAVADCATATWALPDDEVIDCLSHVHRVEQALRAIKLRLVRQLDLRDIPSTRHATSTTNWLRWHLRISGSEAARLVAHARALDQRPALDDALAAGHVNAEQLGAIVTSLAMLPDDVGQDIADAAEEMLVRWAGELDPVQLRQAGTRILAHVAPHLPDQADEAALARAEKAAHRDRYLTVTRIGDGRVRLRGSLDLEAAAIVTAALDPLCTPRRRNRPAGPWPSEYAQPAANATACKPAERDAAASQTAGITASTTGTEAAGAATTSAEAARAATTSAEAARAATTSAEAARAATTGAEAARAATTGAEAARAATTGVEAAGSPTTPDQSAVDRMAADHMMSDQVIDERTPGQRRADALVEICRLALNTGELPVNGGDRPQLVVTAPFDVLNQKVGTGDLDTGGQLSSERVRQLACDAQIMPAVLGGKGQVLDLGRSRRLATGPLRRAVVIRDGGCAFPGCDRPPRWCDTHHLRSWFDGGQTDLANLVLLCRYHHHLVHSGDWHVRLGMDGHPEFVPPTYVDSRQIPRRNPFHRRT